MEELISISPSMLFISNNDWLDEKKQDCFLTNIIEILSEIDKYELHKILWSEKLEEILWTSPQYSPWLNMYDLKNSMVSLLYKYLSSNTVFISGDQPLKSIVPELELTVDKEIIIDAYSKIYNELIVNSKDFNIYNNCINFTYKSIGLISYNEFEYRPKIITNITDYLKTINYTIAFWPNSIKDKEIFNTSIEICKKIHFHEKKILYKFCFSNTFIKKISELDNDLRHNLVFKLTKRLCVTSKEASCDIQLKDEYITEKKEFRFRITPKPSSTRVHYNFQDNSIYFLTYYGVGEHDDGI